MTAAHCTVGQAASPSGLRVLLGEHKTDDATQTKVEVQAINDDPLYDTSNFRNDFSILTLKELAKWVRDIKSVNAEFQFYEEYWRANSSSSSIPKLVASFSTFETEKDDPEKLFAKDGSEYKPRNDLVFALLLEDLEKEDYGHEYTQLTHGLSIDQLSQFVDCLAGFHAETAKVARHIEEQRKHEYLELR